MHKIAGRAAGGERERLVAARQPSRLHVADFAVRCGLVGGVAAYNYVQVVFPGACFSNRCSVGCNA